MNKYIKDLVQIFKVSIRQTKCYREAYGVLGFTDLRLLF